MVAASGGSMSMEAGFRGPHVCKIVGISYRQLDYWARTELATPTLRPAQGSGSQRLYSFEDLVQLKLIKKLLDTGVSLQRVREAIEYVRELGEDLSDVTIVSDGGSIYACKTPSEFIDLLRRGQGVFGIAVGPVMEEVQASVRSLRPSAAGEQAAPAQPGRKAQGED